MQCHLSSACLKGHRRAGSFNDATSSTLQHGLDFGPLDVPIDWVCEYSIEGLPVRAVHAWMIAVEAISASIFGSWQCKVVPAAPNVKRETTVACRWRSA